ncbi:MAG: RiPP maturation radical SAM protein 1 [bacterium]|nr:RiPP maturation radical SAM protein 1 [bacterium]
MRVALIVMPFAAPDRPSLAVGLLDACLERAGIRCDAKYFNVTFWRMLGTETYDVLAKDSALIAWPGEWVFSQLFYGQRCSDWESYQREVLCHPVWGVGRHLHQHVRDALEPAAVFLRVVFESNDWSRYDLVGFTSTFEQTMPSLCLARLIRERHPQVLLAAGGANFEAEMGRPYMEHFEFLDFVSTGEADDSLPQLCCRLRDLREGRTDELVVPPGFLYREGSEIRSTPRTARSFVALDDLPTPNYDTYFQVAQTGANGSAAAVDPVVHWLPIEASRGCWWGEKSHCTFCGLNGEGMGYRKKSWQRVVAESEELYSRYGDLALQFSDNILATEYFRDLLPFWAERRDRKGKFFEIKSNLRREQVRLLKEAGVTHVQAGVESLADKTLRLMRKGVTAAQNVALIRWCVEVGIEPAWNIIYGFPREDMSDYDRILALLRRLTHLPPPEGISSIRMDRFSPNHARWREEGFTAIEPMPAYRHIFPFPEEEIRRLAYYFSYKHPRFAAVLEAGAELVEFGRIWRDKSARRERGELAVKPHRQEGFVLTDTRFNFTPSSRRLSDEELALLLACDAPIASRDRVLRRAGSTLAAGDRARAAVRSGLEVALAELIDRSVIAELGPRLVTLALLPPRERWAGSRRGDTP